MSVDEEMSKNNKNEAVNKKTGSFGVRHIQVILLFFLLAIGVGMRMQLSVAIVAMTGNNTSSNPDIPTYDWDNKSVILSSFYWGYLTLQFIAAFLGKRYGTKYFLLVAMCFNSTASMFIPLAADKLGSYGVMICRVFQGIAQGFFYPSVYNLLGSWTPISERSRMGTIALAGYSFGSILTNFFVGYVSSSSWGWPSTFYLFGGFGYVWAIFWAFFGASTPAEHKSIPRDELDYIESSLGNPEEKQLQVPWGSIFTSLPVLAITLAYIGLNWGLLFLGTETPTYLSAVMGFDLKSNSLLSSLPSFATFLASFGFAWASDYSINKAYFSRGTTRKIFTTIASMGTAIPLLILCYLPDDAKVGSVVMLVACGLFYGAVNGGSSVNQMDLSPRYAGIIMAISNTVANSVGLMAPLVVQAVVTTDSDKSQWKIVFLISAGICTFTNVMYIIFASGEVQPWNSFGKTEEEKPQVDDHRTRKISRKISMVMSNL